jgi:BirA family transcriptional regulator, biotin operon repressor / biotin---[acetyl-CoA-carboxylase] ligase
VTRLHRFDRVGSTQDVLHELAAGGAPAGTAVVAAEQTGGRGSRGRRWHSPVGGLWLSYLWRPRDVTAPETLGVRVGLAIAAALDAVSGLAPVTLKWPNDLILANRKAGGILCEARWHGAALGWVVVGVGLNVRNAAPDDARAPAIALAALQPALDAEALIEPLLAALDALGDSAGPLDDAALASFARRDWLLARELAEPVAGVGAGLEPDGALRVRRADGTIVLVRSGPIVPAGRWEGEPIHRDGDACC